MANRANILIIAHTPKRSLSSPITQNDLAGSKKLYNFFDSVFAIGKSAKDASLRYIKQLKVRAGEFRYGSDNVMLYKIVHTGGYVHFEFRDFAREYAHLRENPEEDKEVLLENIRELHQQGKSVREIADELDLSKSRVGRIVVKLKPETEESS